MISCDPLSKDFGFMVKGDGLTALLSLDRSQVLTQFKSRDGGLLIFRGFSVTLEVFRAFTEQYGTDFVVHPQLDQRDYVDDSDRTLATVSRGQNAIDFHFEMAGTPACADILWMYCVRPAKARGRTGFVDGIKVLQNLTNPTRRLFEQHGHRYFRKNIPLEQLRSIIPWIKGRADAERWLGSVGISAGIVSYHLDDQDRLTYEFYRCPIRESKFCGEVVFVSGMLDYPGTLLGDRPMPQILRNEVCQAVYQNAIWIDWHPGDIALIDNTRVMHAREAFEDTQRRMLVRYSALRE